MRSGKFAGWRKANGRQFGNHLNLKLESVQPRYADRSTLGKALPQYSGRILQIASRFDSGSTTKGVTSTTSSNVRPAAARTALRLLNASLTCAFRIGLQAAILTTTNLPRNKLQTDGLTPAGFRIRLCSTTRCLGCPALPSRPCLPGYQPPGRFVLSIIPVAGGRFGCAAACAE